MKNNTTAEKFNIFLDEHKIGQPCQKDIPRIATRPLAANEYTWQDQLTKSSSERMTISVGAPVTMSINVPFSIL